MAPAIVHFLVGASLVLLLATPLALRYRAVRQWSPGLVVLGGLWGLFPDVHHVAPGYRDDLRAVHGSPWADLFAFHYGLDRPVVRELSLESTAVSILVFVVAATGFTLASRAGERGPRSWVARALASTTGLVVAAALGAGVFGGLLHVTDRMSAVAGLVGRERALAGWGLVYALSLIGGTLFVAFLTLAVPDRYATDPRAGTLLGLLFGLLAWALVAVVVPIWPSAVLEAHRSIPFLSLEWPSLLVLALAGALFGAWYPIVTGAVTPLENS